MKDFILMVQSVLLTWTLLLVGLTKQVYALTQCENCSLIIYMLNERLLKADAEK